MTAYGRSNLKIAVGHIVVEIQSVNRKHLEIHVNLPNELEYFDIEIKKWISAHVSRGNINVKITASFETEVPFKVLPNLPLAKQTKEAWEKIAEHLLLDKNAFNLAMLVDVPDIVLIEENSEFQEVYRDSLKEAVEVALQNFIAMRMEEGNILQQDIENRLVLIHPMLQRIEKRTPFATQKYREKLIARLEEIVPGHIENEEKILREIAVFAEKIDITEEITRFFCHISRFKEIMQSTLQSAGKTLEFLLQEMAREINTIGSKSSDIDISRDVIEIKSELERIREQIQNIE